MEMERWHKHNEKLSQQNHSKNLRREFVFKMCQFRRLSFLPSVTLLDKTNPHDRWLNCKLEFLSYITIASRAHTAPFASMCIVAAVDWTAAYWPVSIGRLGDDGGDGATKSSKQTRISWVLEGWEKLLASPVAAQHRPPSGKIGYWLSHLGLSPREADELVLVVGWRIEARSWTGAEAMASHILAAAWQAITMPSLGWVARRPNT